MKKTFRLAALLSLCAILLCGCMTSPADSLKRQSAEGQSLISASTAELAPEEQEMTLYFRYGDTAFLAPERRLILVERNESLEKAVVEALIMGPAATASSLSPLFPAGTEVLAVASQGDTMFITFNEAFLGRYADEPADGMGEWRAEGPLRRQLCLDSLAATLTEEGLCAKVQVLVYRSSGASTSMRLQAGFLNRSGDQTLLAPLTRNEKCLLTAYNTASLLLASWLHQDWESLYDLTAREGTAARPGEQSAYDAFAAGKVLSAFSLSPGAASYDGQSAVFAVDLTFLGQGGDVALAGYPLLLTRERGLWKMDYGRLTAMMNAQ